jgi:tryptophan halogenase
VYFGQRVIPQGYDPLADAVDGAALARKMQQVREQVQTAAVRMPTHEEFLRSYCPAVSPAMPGARA